MSWVASALLVTPAASRSAAAALLAQVSGSPGDAAPESFSVPVAALSGGDVTHWACHTRLRASSLASLPALASAVPGSLWHVTAHDDDDGEQAAARLSVDAWLHTQELARWRDAEDPL